MGEKNYTKVLHFFRAKSAGFALPKHDLVIPSQNMYPASDFQDFPGFSTNPRPKILNFCPTDFFENRNSFWDRSETFISAIYWTNTKIRVPPGTHLSGGFCENPKTAIRTTLPTAVSLDSQSRLSRRLSSLVR